MYSHPSTADLPPTCDDVSCRCRTSVHTLETSAHAHQPDATPALPGSATFYETTIHANESVGELFRHSSWLPLRRRVLRGLVTTAQPVARRLRFLSCGSRYSVYEDRKQPGKYKLAANACHDRFCLPCANERARIVAFNVHNYLKGSPCRFITLTLRSGSEPLGVLIDKLYTSFKKLRAHPIWRKTQTGGVAFLEVKWCADTQRWHPHFHVLAQGKFLPHAQLSNVWKSITTDSWVVDIRPVTQVAHAIRYITKYASKPFSPEMLRTQDRLEEAMIALSGVRMILTFGAWKGVRVTAKPDQEKYKLVGSVAELARQAVDGDAVAMDILAELLGSAVIPFIADAKNPRFLDPRPKREVQLDYFVALEAITPW